MNANAINPAPCRRKALVVIHQLDHGAGLFHGGNGMAKAKTQTPYWQKLRDPRWQKKRLEILSRDEWTCQSCFDGGATLNVHHGYYAKGLDPWEYPDASLVTLCEDCHKDAGDSIANIHRLVGTLSQEMLFGLEQLIEYISFAPLSYGDSLFLLDGLQVLASSEVGRTVEFAKDHCRRVAEQVEDERRQRKEAKDGQEFAVIPDVP